MGANHMLGAAFSGLRVDTSEEANGRDVVYDSSSPHFFARGRGREQAGPEDSEEEVFDGVMLAV
jgi:hypothetical protein